MMKLTMKMRFNTLLAAAVFCLAFSAGSEVMAQNSVLYRATLANNKGRSVVVRQSGKNLTISLLGFGRTIELSANGGGISTCRTILEHNSGDASVILSLAIPDPRAACRMLPSFIAVESRTFGLSLDDEPLKKVAGSNAGIRKATERAFGKIESEGEE